jgi:hypothetical protein
MNYNAVILEAIKATIEYLDAWGIKTYDFFLRTLTASVRAVYAGNMGGEFVDILGNLIQGQLTKAYNQAWKDSGGEGALPDEMRESLEEMILSEYDHVDQFYRDIVDARVDGGSIEPLLSRAQLWANRYNDAYNQAMLQAADEKDKFIWIYGDTEHCETCAALNGIVASARVWEAAGFRPQSPPNDMLDCGGWRCRCRLEPTEQRSTPKALETLMNIATSRSL